MERISANEVDDISAPLALDLIAAFSLMEEDTYRLINKAEEEGWTSEQLISEIENMLSTGSASNANANANSQTGL